MCCYLTGPKFLTWSQSLCCCCPRKGLLLPRFLSANQAPGVWPSHACWSPCPGLGAFILFLKRHTVISSGHSGRPFLVSRESRPPAVILPLYIALLDPSCLLPYRPSLKDVTSWQALQWELLRASVGLVCLFTIAPVAQSRNCQGDEWAGQPLYSQQTWAFLNLSPVSQRWVL